MRLDNLSVINDVSNELILNDISYDFKTESIYALKVDNQFTKGIFLSVISGLNPNYSGELFLGDSLILKEDLLKFNRDEVSFILKNTNLIDYLSVYENVNHAVVTRKKHKVTKEELVDCLKKFGLNIDINSRPQDLTLCEQQQVAMVRALLSGGKIILADQLMVGVDDAGSVLIIDELKKMAKEYGKIVIIVTNDFRVINQCDELLELRSGKLI